MSDETKQGHTPGPWRWDGQHVRMRGAGGKIVLLPGDGVGHEETRLANARLIAAAPELLEACRLISGKMYDDPVGRCAVLAASEAIAKATGDQS